MRQEHAVLLVEHDGRAVALGQRLGRLVHALGPGVEHDVGNAAVGADQQRVVHDAASPLPQTSVSLSTVELAGRGRRAHELERALERAPAGAGRFGGRPRRPRQQRRRWSASCECRSRRRDCGAGPAAAERAAARRAVSDQCARLASTAIVRCRIDRSRLVLQYAGERTLQALRITYFLNTRALTLMSPRSFSPGLSLILKRPRASALPPLYVGVLQVARLLLPEAEFQFLAGRQILDRELAVGVGHRGVRILADDDPGAHPGMDVAADLHRQSFFLAANL